MKRRYQKVIFFAAAIGILCFAAIYGGLRYRESAVLHPAEEASSALPSKTVVSDGISYFPRQDITVILVMGIDETGPARDSLSYNNEGEADMVMLAIFDEKEKTFTVLALNRDTMMEMPVLGLGGKQAGTRYAQLALSHTYGSGLEDSCENTRKTVSGFLNGITIDYYIAMNMDAVPILNDAVGGVTVQVEDDFSLVDATIPLGTVTLRGDQALTFVQTRRNVGDAMNLSRIRRQKEYVAQFSKALAAKTEAEDSFVLSTYEKAAPYLVSDLPVSTLSGMIERYQNYELKQILSPEGENVRGEEFYEFYADQEKLEELILNLFYAPK